MSLKLSLEPEHDCLVLLRTHGHRPDLVDQRRYLREHRPTALNRWIVATRGPDAR